MDKKIKALFFDIDGTLVSFKTHKIPQSTVDALEQAKKNGVEVYISTGRPQLIINNLGQIEHLIDGYITTNGACCFVGDKVVSQHAILPEDVKKIIEAADRDDYPAIVVGEHHLAIHHYTDEVYEILDGSDKIYTCLKIDEVNNLGAARIRIRSLIAAIRAKKAQGQKRTVKPASIDKVSFTKEMRKDYTILCPQMSPFHFSLLQAAFNSCGYNLEVLPNDNKHAVDVGLKYVNNDACYPSLITVGMFMDATAAIFILVPILLPAVQAVGVSPLFFVVFLVITLSFGLITPPVGVCLYAAENVTGLPLEKIIKASVPWIALIAISLCVFILFPGIIEAPVALVFGS